MSYHVKDWPEPIIPVQSLTDLPSIPARYIKPLEDRATAEPENLSDDEINIPVVDLSGLTAEDAAVREETKRQIGKACRSWGFFQVVNHGVDVGVMADARRSWREFFEMPVEKKKVYANNPKTYEGYGSRLGVEKEVSLDWSDYYFLHYLPSNLKDHSKWPAHPPRHSEVVEEYLGQLVKLCGRLMKVLSTNLGLEENYLQNAFGGEEVGACLRVNYYPKCPQPDLTLGLSPHSDPGGMTMLLPDHGVRGLQVRKDGKWVTVKPLPHAFIVNIGDQLQVLSNAIYKSVEHRVIVNPNMDRVSLALFYNPRGELLIEPAKELVTPENPALYPSMIFNEYRSYIRLKGPRGKSQVESLKSPR